MIDGEHSTEKDHDAEQEQELSNQQAMISRSTKGVDARSSVGFGHLRTNSLAQQTRDGSSQPLMSPVSSNRQLHHYSFPNLTRAGSPVRSSCASHDARERPQQGDSIKYRPGENVYGSDLPSPARSLPSSSSYPRAYPNERSTEEGSETMQGERPQTMIETFSASTSDADGRRRAISSPGPQSTIPSSRESPTLTSFQRKQDETHLRTRLSPFDDKGKNGNSLPTMLPPTVHDIALSSSAAFPSNLDYVKLPSRQTSSSSFELEKQAYTGPESMKSISPAHDARETDWTPNHYMTAKLRGNGKATYVEESKPIKIPSSAALSPAINSEPCQEEGTGKSCGLLPLLTDHYYRNYGAQDSNKSSASRRSV
jgi:hypothetical protein